MQQALDMLNGIADYVYFDQTLAEVITALEQALAVNTGEWVGLTEEDRNDCLVSADPCECLAKPESHQLMEDVEAKLREKNT